MLYTMKRIIFILLLSWSIMPLLAQPRSAGTTVDGIVAVIGKEIIMQSDLRTSFELFSSNSILLVSSSIRKC